MTWSVKHNVKKRNSQQTGCQWILPEQPFLSVSCSSDNVRVITHAASWSKWNRDGAVITYTVTHRHEQTYTLFIWEVMTML